MIFVGGADRYFPAVKESVALMPNVTFVSFPGLNHGDCINRTDVVLPPIKRFLAEVTKKIK